jgi:hypothetical protein
MKFALKELLNSTRGKYVFSILLGIGLASLFRKACSNRNCLVFKAPSLDKIKNKIFNYNNKCYKFKDKGTSCVNNNDNVKQVQVEDTLL